MLPDLDIAYMTNAFPEGLTLYFHPAKSSCS